MLAVKDGNFTAVFWDFEQPEQNVSDRTFFTKITPAHAAQPIELRITGLAPDSTYRLQVHRTGFHANDAYSAYLEIGAPKNLPADQIGQLKNATRDLPVMDRTLRSGSDGIVDISLPMNSNDIVLVTLRRGAKTSK